MNAGAIIELAKLGTKITPFPADFIKEAREKAAMVIENKAKAGPLAAKIVASYRDALGTGNTWSRIGSYMEQALRAP